jgi:hypothetical protein
MTNDTLTRVLGGDYWTAETPTASAAIDQACRRMAAGRPAVHWSHNGRHFVAWGVKS